MRSVFFSGIGLLLSLVLLSPAAQATGNVLLPSPLPSDNSSLPDLGLGPPQSTSGNAAATAPSSPPPSYQSSQRGGVQTAPVSTPFVPAITRMPIQPPADPMTPVIVQQKDTSQYVARTGANLPYRLTLSIGEKSVFGAKDVQAITSKLGLKRDQISSACSLTVEGMMQTDRGAYFISGGSSPPPIMIPYAGVIKGFMMSASALCNADIGKLPRGRGIILSQINGIFDIMLQPVACDPPRGQPSSLTITYNGSGKSQCVYN